LSEKKEKREKCRNICYRKGGPMSSEITVQEALALPGAKLIDVRSESEYVEATIPGAVNLPILHDAERVQVGTAYRNQGADDAKLLGINFVAPRLPQIIKQYQELQQKEPLVVFCWRGGMRSKSVCSFLEDAGIPVYRLVGGYKAYRRYVNEYLERPLPHKTAVIHGLTGIGKTEILVELQKFFEPAVDLEGLANNRGSVFGQIGLAPQPSQKMFEGLLVRELAFWEQTGYIIVECESRRIGRIILPEVLVNAMRSGIHILAYCPIEERIQRIKRIYAGNIEHNKNGLKSAIMSLEKRLGKAVVGELTGLVDRGRLDEVVEYLLIKYYDPLYKYPTQPSPDYDLNVDTTDVQRAAKTIKEYMNQLLTRNTGSKK
jgi:tRNA 2-selenouridine synthase